MVLTPKDLREIRTIARENGDTAKVKLCSKALKGDSDAFADVIVDEILRVAYVTRLITDLDK